MFNKYGAFQYYIKITPPRLQSLTNGNFEIWTSYTYNCVWAPQTDPSIRLPQCPHKMNSPKRRFKIVKQCGHISGISQKPPNAGGISYIIMIWWKEQYQRIKQQINLNCNVKKQHHQSKTDYLQDTLKEKLHFQRRLQQLRSPIRDFLTTVPAIWLYRDEPPSEPFSQGL